MSNHSNTKTAYSSKKALRVLFIASANKGTMTPVVINQAEALIAEGVQVDFFEIRGKGFRGYMRNVIPLRKFLRTHQYDAIHAHYSLSAFAASLAGAKPLIVSLMGSDVKAARWYKFIIRFLAFFFRWKAIIVKSNDMYRDLGIKRAIVIPNGVNLERFHPMNQAECQKRLGWDGGVVHILFPANASRPEKDYALAEATVKELANERVSELEIELHAFDNTPNEEAPYWYNAADVVLMTSKWEGSPNAIKEALACSRPIVVTNVGDVVERTSGVEGCFVAQSRDPQELSLLLQQAMKTSTTSGYLKIQSDKLDRQSINNKLIEIYQ